MGIDALHQVADPSGVSAQTHALCVYPAATTSPWLIVLSLTGSNGELVVCEAIPSPVIVAGGCGRTLATMPGPAVDPPRFLPLVRRESAVCFQSPERPPGTEFAQFIRFCSGLKLVYMYTRMPQGGLSTFTRLARKWRGEARRSSSASVYALQTATMLSVESYAQHCRSIRP